MKRADELMRNYAKSDILMLQQAQVMHDNFVIDQADFVVLVPDLATPFETLWQSEINTAQAISSDSTVLDYLQILTHNAQLELGVAQTAFQVLLFYVKLAYPNDTAIQNSFGADKYIKYHRNQLRMIDLLEQAHDAASQPANSAALIAKGFTQIQIDGLATIRDTLYDKNRLQENAKNHRLMSTYNRISALNAVWHRMWLVSNASKLVYMDNYTKIKQYLLYPEGENGELQKITANCECTTLTEIEVSMNGNPDKTVNVDFGDETSEDMTFDGIHLMTVNHVYAAIGNYIITSKNNIKDVLEYHSSNSQLTTFNIPDDAENINTYVLQNNKFPTAIVDGILIRINEFNKVGKLVNLADNEPPSPAGLAAKTALEARGWVVIVATS